MLMGDQDSVQRFGVDINGGESGEGFALAEAGVNQDARVLAADVAAVAGARSGENADANDGGNLGSL